MPRLDNDAQFGLQDKRAGRGSSTGSLSAATEVNYTEEAALDTALAAVSATTFSAARLASMTKNDKVYALRFTNDAAGMFRG